MRISIMVHGHLKSTSAAGPEAKEHTVTNGTTVRDLLAELNIWESEIRRVLRNGELARLDSKLRARDRLEFFGTT